MNTSKTFLRVRVSLVVAGLASLLGGCVIDAKIGDDPMAGEDGGATDGGESTSTTAFPGHTSAEPGEDSATVGGSPGSASATSTSGAPGEDSGGDDSASVSASASGTFPDVDPQTALELCEVPIVPPGPDDPVIIESVLCDGGCLIEVETSVEVDLLDEYGQCLCEAMDCGPAVGGTSTSEGPVDTDTGGGDPDGCGDFPDGEQGFICDCEMCSIVVSDVDAAWLETEADLEAICACMCGGAGCGLPI